MRLSIQRGTGIPAFGIRSQPQEIGRIAIRYEYYSLLLPGRFPFYAQFEYRDVNFVIGNIGGMVINVFLDAIFFKENFHFY